MRTDKRVVAKVEAARVKPGPLLATGALILGLAALGLPVRAETVIKSHGISTFGDLKLPADFPHLPYVNPNAPKGGEISEWSPGSFDSFNPYAIAGNAAALASIGHESILSGTFDDVSAAYCLLCETMEYPEDRSWVIFNLRKDVTFADGSPMTAEDILFTYELFRDKGIPEYRSAQNAKFQSVEVLEPYRIKFTFAPGTPFRDMPALAGGMTAFSKAHYEANNLGLEKSGLVPFMGTGPYVAAHWLLMCGLVLAFQFTPLQIEWIGLVVIGLYAVSIAVDTCDLDMTKDQETRLEFWTEWAEKQLNIADRKLDKTYDTMEKEAEKNKKNFCETMMPIAKQALNELPPSM